MRFNVVFGLRQVAEANIETAVTFAFAELEGAGAGGEPVAVDEARLETAIMSIKPTATVTAHPTVVLTSELPSPCGPGNFMAAASCTACAAGQADHDGSSYTACEECAVGAYAGAGATACGTCGAGLSDIDANPATPCTAPHLVTSEVVLSGAANKNAIDLAIATAVGVHPHNVQIIQVRKTPSWTRNWANFSPS